jgi:adenosylcobyric acid synthase
MLQGTGSDVGKSLLLTALARHYARRGLAVRPFKPQNMSNNAAVTEDGGEIGRAQALQARAAGVPASVDMNPILLKPEGETGAQVVVQGRIAGRADARAYHAMKPGLLPRVIESFERLSAEADLVLVEGAGSPAEINLREGDIANMGFAEAADVPVVLVGDIDRGGVIASLVGTWRLLEEGERARLKGYIVNKFRGDVSLFQPAFAPIKAETGLDCLGVVPYFAEAALLPAEDALGLDRLAVNGHGPIRIVVPRLPRIANFDDLDPLRAEPDVAVEVIPPGKALPAGDLILLPGSKATLSDLAFLRDQGWDIDILAHRRRGGRILGLCAGYQMLGREVADPQGIEGRAGAAPGLGLLDVATELTPAKTLRKVAGTHLATGAPVHGYEMHIGRTDGPDRARAALLLMGQGEDGARSVDGRVEGCYVHGLFAADAFRRRFLADLRPGRTSTVAYEQSIEEVLDRWAEHVARAVDTDRLLEIARAR